MAWTNIRFPDRFENINVLNDRIEILEKEKEMLNRKLDMYEKEFRNIFEAALEFKTIEIISGKEKIKLKLDQ